MTAGARKLALTAHVAASVGWLGAVVAFLALAITAVASENQETVRAAYIASSHTATFVLVPLAIASLATGLLQSLVTVWGVLRHYWVVAKLVLTVVATAILVAYTRTTDEAARRAADETTSSAQLGELGPSLVLHASLAIVVLLLALGLAVYKPRGVTALGRRALCREGRS